MEALASLRTDRSRPIGTVIAFARIRKNNAAERTIRSRVIWHYTSFGSGRATEALLTEQLYSPYATLHEWGLNAYRWTKDYLAACARNDRKAPADLEQWRTNDGRHEEPFRLLPGPGAAAVALGEHPEALLALVA